MPSSPPGPQRKVSGTVDSALALNLAAPLSEPPGAVSETRAKSAASGEIPDLDVDRSEAARQRDVEERHRNREFEEVPPSGFEFALDLPEDDDFHRRSSPGRAPSSSKPPTPAGAAATSGSLPPLSRESRPSIPSPSLRPMLGARASLPPADRSRPAAAPSETLPLGPAPFEEQPLLRRLLPGLVLVGLSIVITLADQAYSAATTEMFTLGSLRATWIAAVLLFAGLGLIAYRVLPRS